VRALIAALLLITACAPVTRPDPLPQSTTAPTAPTAPPSGVPEETPIVAPSPVMPTGPQLDVPLVALATTAFPIESTFALTPAATSSNSEFAARWGIERYLEGLDRYRDHGDFLPVQGAFGEAVAAALVASRTPGVKRTFVLESLLVERIYRKPWSTQALADVRVTIVDRAVDRSAPDQRESGLLRLTGDRRLQVIDAWNESAGRWFNGRVPDDPAGLRESVAQAVGIHLRSESWLAGGPIETYAGGAGATPFKTARAAHLATFDRGAIVSRTFDEVAGVIERHDTFAELPGGIATVRIAATVVTTDAAGRTQRQPIERRLKVFFGNWIPEVVDEEITPGVWRSGGDLALVEIDINLA
jgi:hypothetical protein